MAIAFGRVLPVLRMFDVAKAQELFYLGNSITFWGGPSSAGTRG
jgi:hypothetical protein